MPKYLFRSSHTVEGLKGLLREGGSSRREAVEQTFKSLGGALEAFYYAFGETDVFVIAELPDNVSAAAAALAANAPGTGQITTTVLITPEEVDRAVKKSVDYRPPGR